MLFRFDFSSSNQPLTEFVGTFFMVLAGCGAIVVYHSLDGVIGHGGGVRILGHDDLCHR